MRPSNPICLFTRALSKLGTRCITDGKQVVIENYSNYLKTCSVSEQGGGALSNFLGFSPEAVS